MIYDPAPMAIVIFLLFVVGTVALSFFLGRRAKSSEGYFAAHGQIPWLVNGVAFAGEEPIWPEASAAVCASGAGPPPRSTSP